MGWGWGILWKGGGGGGGAGGHRCLVMEYGEIVSREFLHALGVLTGL